MYTKRAFTTITTIDALERLGIVTTPQHLRRLCHLAKGVVTATAMVKKLRKLIATFRTEPDEVLEIKGVGIKTFQSIALLSKLLAANEVKSEFGISDNISAVLTILQTFNRGASPEVKVLIEAAKDKLYKARTKIELERITEGLQKSVEATVKTSRPVIQAHTHGTKGRVTKPSW